MAEEPRAAVTATVELDQFLLDAKLSVPRPRAGAVSRAVLIDTVRSSDCKVVGVTAPAGYGKTTLLAQWAQAEDRRVGWVSLDRFDNDPAVLLVLLASAYSRVSPGDADLVADIGGLGLSTLGRAAPRLAAAFRSSPIPFVLMLDDLHELRSPACHDALEVVISGLPAGSQLAAASRSEQPHLSRSRALGEAIELRTGDLAMDVGAAEQIFSEAHVQVSHEAVAAVTDRAEGWPVGLHLAAVIARDSGGEPSGVSGEDPYVADYLYREAVSQLPPRAQRFLRRTAVLDQLSAPLCDAVLGGPGAQEQLRALERANIFLIPLDRRREWYRYHELFREFLLGELRRIEPEATMKLHLRAADWYESHGSQALAVEHLLSTTERDRCVQLVTALILPTYQAGNMSTVQRWLSTLGVSTVEEYPPLAVLAGWIATLTGQTAEAERWAAIIDAASYDLVPADGTASFDSARAMLRAMMCPSGPEQVMTDARNAVDQEPEWSPWRDVALCLLGEAFLLAGDRDGAHPWFEEASRVAARTANADSIVAVSETELAVVAMDRGMWTEAAQRLDITFAVIERHRMYDYATSVLAFAASARLAAHRGDLQEAARQLTQAMRARGSCTFVLPYLAVRGRLQMAKVYLAMGDLASARHLLREIKEITFHRPQLGVLVTEVTEFSDKVSARAQELPTGAAPLTQAELRLLPYLQTHLTIAEIGKRLFISHNTVSSEVASIYRKLGVSSRSAAVEQATTVGLLGQ